MVYVTLFLAGKLLRPFSVFPLSIKSPMCHFDLWLCYLHVPLFALLSLVPPHHTLLSTSGSPLSWEILTGEHPVTVSGLHPFAHLGRVWKWCTSLVRVVDDETHELIDINAGITSTLWPHHRVCPSFPLNVTSVALPACWKQRLFHTQEAPVLAGRETRGIRIPALTHTHIHTNAHTHKVVHVNGQSAPWGCPPFCSWAHECLWMPNWQLVQQHYSK